MGGDLEPPGVEVFCVHGSGVPTVEKLVYKEGESPGIDPAMEKGDGDGTVNIRSLRACTAWQGKQRTPVHHHVLQGINHMGILRDAAATEYVDSLVGMVNDDINHDTEGEILPIIEIIQ